MIFCIKFVIHRVPREDQKFYFSHPLRKILSHDSWLCEDSLIFFPFSHLCNLIGKNVQEDEGINWLNENEDAGYSVYWLGISSFLDDNS